MSKKEVTSKKMLLAAVAALAACGTFGIQANAATPTPAGTAPTFSFGEEQDGAGSAINQVSYYIDSDSTIKHAIVNMTASNSRFNLTQSSTGDVQILGTRYNVSAPTGVTVYNSMDTINALGTDRTALWTQPTLISGVTGLTKIYDSDTYTTTSHASLNIDLVNNNITNTVISQPNTASNQSITVNSNIIGNNIQSYQPVYSFWTGHHDFNGDIIGNTSRVRIVENNYSADYNTPSTVNYNVNVIGNTIEDSDTINKGGVIRDYISNGQTSTVRGIFANNSIILNEPRNSGYAARGGALYVDTGTSPTQRSTLNISNSLFSGNSAIANSSTNPSYATLSQGGAIYLEGTEIRELNDETRAIRTVFNIENTDFVNNSASNGGAIYLYSGELNVTDCNFIGNTATNGSAIYSTAYQQAYSDDSKASSVNISALNKDVSFVNNGDYDIYINSGDLSLNAAAGRTLELDNGVYMVKAVNMSADKAYINTGSGSTGTVQMGIFYGKAADLTIGGGIAEFDRLFAKTLDIQGGTAVVGGGSYTVNGIEGASIVENLSFNNGAILSFQDGSIGDFAIEGGDNNISGSGTLNLKLDYDGLTETIDRIMLNGSTYNVGSGVKISLNGVNVLSDWAGSAATKDVTYILNASALGSGVVQSAVVTSTVATSGEYLYTFTTGGSYNEKLSVTREYVGDAGSLPAVIQDATTDSFSVTTDGFNAFEGTAFTSLGAINTGKNTFTIDGNGRGIDGNYGSTPTKGGGVTVGSGQTLNLNNVNTSNFSTFATTTMADADNKGTINVSGGASSSAANVYDNNLDFMNDGNLNFTGGYVTLNGGISNSLSTAVNEAKNGSTTIQDGAHVTLGSNAVLAQNNLTIGSGGEFTASTDQLNGIGQLAGSSVHNISNQGTLNISAGSNTLTTRINDTGSSTGTIKLLGDITSSSTVRAANLDLNGNTYTLGSSGAKLFLLGAENGSIVANNTGDMQLTSPGSSTIDITDVTIDGLAYITLDGRIKADASKIMNIGNDIRLYRGTKLTLVGNTNTSSFVDFAGDGDVTIADSMANSGTFANHSLTINAKDSGNNTISFTTDADKLQTETAIANGGRLVLTGNVQDADNSGLLSQSISGDGTTVIAGNIVLDSTGNYVIGQDIEITAGGNSLDAYVNKFTGDVSVGGQVGNTGDYSSIILHGANTDTQYTFNQSITGDGYAEISNDLNLSLGSNGSISNVLNNGILTAALTQVGSVENNGTFNTHGIMNGRTIAGTGTTVLDDTLNITGSTASTIAGTLDMNGQTINMQYSDLSAAEPPYVYSETDASNVTYNTLNVGQLNGTGNLKIDVNMADGSSDKINVTGSEDNNATVTVTSVNVVDSATLANNTYDDYVTYVDGNTNGITFGDTTVSTITSDNHRYTFSNGSDGKLNVIVKATAATLSEFIQGDIEDKDDPPAVTATGFSLVDDLTVDTDLGTTDRSVYNAAHEGEPGIPIDELSIFVNNHTLSGSQVDKIYTEIPDGEDPTDYEDQGDGTYLHIVDNSDPSNPVYETRAVEGVTAGNNMTLNILGQDLDNQGTMTGFNTAVTVDESSSVNIQDMIFTGNGTDIVNNSNNVYDEDNEVWTSTGLSFYGANEVDTIDGEGTTNVFGSLTVNDSLTQDSVNVGSTGSLTVDADGMTIDDGYISNSGEVHLTGSNATLGTEIRNGSSEGTTYIDGDITSNVSIGQAIVIDGTNSLNIDAGNVGGTVTNNAGTLTLTGGSDWTPAILGYAVNGNGTTIIDGHIANYNYLENQVQITEDGILDTGAAGLTSTAAIINDGTLNLFNSTPGTENEELGQDITSSSSDLGTTNIFGNILNDGHSIESNVTNFGTLTNENGAEISGFSFVNNGMLNNDDTEISASEITNNGMMNNTGSSEVGGSMFTNNGFTSNQDDSLISAGTVTNNGMLDNDAGVSAGVINNNGYTDNTGSMNAGTINNSGTTINNGEISTGGVNNTGALYNGVILTPNGPVANGDPDNDVGVISGPINNEGLAINDGYMSGTVTNSGGTFYNGVEVDANGNLVSTDTSSGQGVISGPFLNYNEMVQAVDENGDPVYDENGDPVMVVDDVADVINGGKIEGPVVQNTGNFSNGIYQTQVVDEEGNPVVDENGNPVVEDHLLANAEINTGALINDGGNFTNAANVNTGTGIVVNDDGGTMINKAISDEVDATITTGQFVNQNDSQLLNEGTINAEEFINDEALVQNEGDINADVVGNYDDAIFLNNGNINGDVENEYAQMLNNGVINGDVENDYSGLLVSTGTINGGVDNYSDSQISNTGDINGDVNNFEEGIFQNDGTINGDVRNEDDGKFLNNGDIYGWADNYDDGEFVNNGLIDTSAASEYQYIDNEGTYTNNDTIIGGLENDGTFVNNGVIDSTTSDSDYVYNDGEFINTGVVSTDVVDNDGLMDNSGDMEATIVENEGMLGNTGVIVADSVENYGLVGNSGVIVADVNSTSDAMVALGDGGTVIGDVTGGNLVVSGGNAEITGDVDVDSIAMTDLSGDGLGTFAVGGDLTSQNFSTDGGTLNTQNGATNTSTLGNILLANTMNFELDADTLNNAVDAISGALDSSSNPDATINISGINLIADDKTAGTKRLDMFAGDETSRAALKDHFSASADALKDFLVNPIFKYSGSYDSNDGYLVIDKRFNPAVFVAPVAAQLGGYANQLNSYDEAFRNMDMYMLMTKSQRQALKFRNKYAAADGDKVFDPTMFRYDNPAGWFRPYATFEKVGLKNGPKVSNVAYGSYFGGESEMKDLGHGWDGMWGAYVGYNGSHQTFNGNGIYQNGGTVGLVGMAYKGNFFTGLTINTGANVADANTMYGHEDFTMLMAGVASKTGYNWELAHGKFIIQPSYLMSYSFVNTFDYTNAAGVRIKSDPLHAIQIEPGLKFIGNLKNGWQPYAGISMVWNVMDKTHFHANDVALPEMSIRPYVKYGVGVRKVWGERFAGFLQTYLTNGGRNGVGIQFGFRWMLGGGKDPSPYTKSKKAKAISGAAPISQKKVIKELSK